MLKTKEINNDLDCNVGYLGSSDQDFIFKTR